jgi:metal-responsive CopG/Arc/MetJ family transcriptional regulator
LVRLHSEQARAIDEWRRQEGDVSRPEAIRRLLDQALKKR